MKTSARIDWIDNAKAIGICLVVLGHTSGLPEFAFQLIYSFHMPLFFFLSGYLLKSSTLHLPFPDYLKRLWRTILVPYVGFWVISYIYWLITHTLVLDPAKYDGLGFWDLFSGLLYGTGDIKHNLYIINVDLWFFTCLFITNIFHYFCKRWSSIRGFIVIMALFGGFTPFIPTLIGFRLPWNIELSGVAMVFFGSGYLLQSMQMPNRKILGRIGLMIFPIWVVMVWVNGGVDMNTMIFGNLWLFYLGAGTGIFLAIVLARLLPPTRLSRWLAINTIIIFPMHQLMFSSFSGIGVRILRFNPGFKDTLTVSILYLVLVIVCSYPVVYLIRRYLPYLIGRR